MEQPAHDPSVAPVRAIHRLGATVLDGFVLSRTCECCAREDRTPGGPSNSKSSSARLGQKCSRILIADDSETARRLLRGLIGTVTSWQVCAEAQSGYEAITKAADLKPDLIILDLRMPQLDGLRTAHAISQTMPSVPILLYTLFNSPEVERQAKKAGVRHVVSKTAGSSKLMGAIAELLPSPR